MVVLSLSQYIRQVRPVGSGGARMLVQVPRAMDVWVRAGEPRQRLRHTFAVPSHPLPASCCSCLPQPGTQRVLPLPPCCLPWPKRSSSLPPLSLTFLSFLHLSRLPARPLRPLLPSPFTIVALLLLLLLPSLPSSGHPSASYSSTLPCCPPHAERGPECACELLPSRRQGKRRAGLGVGDLEEPGGRGALTI